ncbi:MAG: acyl-CoA dehydrogenase family protein [Candidatus Eremiobacteraeota bacterium]|nr:acyl-CoA dehydrogenase family protein [Candidatus Eremiobacteraeota bacterium]
MKCVRPPEAVASAEELLSIDDMLSPDERMVRDVVRRFVEKEILPLEAEHFDKGTFPLDVGRRLGSELGLFGCTLPEEYGGSGVSHTAYGIANEELEFGGSGWRSLLSVQSGLVMYPIFQYGTEEQKRKWLPGLADGRFLGCFGLTESGSGSDPASMRTRIKKAGSDFIVNGTKAWITNGSVADVAVVWGRDEEGSVQGVLVEKGMKGFTARNEEHKYSLRASVTSYLMLDEVRIPEANVLPGARGLGAALRCLNQARYGISWGAVGSARFCFKEALCYSLSREQFGAPIASFQLQQEKLAWMFSEIFKARLLCLRIGRLKEKFGLHHALVSMAKRNNVAMARECARLAREIHGAYGISGDYPVWRHMADMESVYTYEGTHDIHTLIIGEALTGISAFRGAGDERQ